MPTISSSHYPKPISWDEFEEIALSACKLKWGNPNLTRHGRQGQAQQGVDIFGRDNLERLVGVQCKNTLGTISEKIIDDEVVNAEKFQPAISSLFIATSANSDAPLQRYVRDISSQRHLNGKFTVDILFWGDIMHDLAKDINEVMRYYPQFFQGQFQSQPQKTTSQIQRQRDVDALEELFNVIDIESISGYLDFAPKYFSGEFVDHIENFRRVIENPSFSLYDANLDARLRDWLGQWQNIVGLMHSAPYNLTSDNKLLFYMPMDFCEPQWQDIYNNIENSVWEFQKIHADFCNFIRANYLEIDLKKTSKFARNFY
ncbi:MAG: hypothetical protein V4857_08935 [Pseudomonadota bacterium]